MLLLKVNKEKNRYDVQYTEEDAQEVVDLFGTDTLPTPFTLQCNINAVRDEIQSRHTQLVKLG